MNWKQVLKAVASAVATTVISVVALTVAYGTPTEKQLIEGSVEMFVVALAVFLFAFKKSS